MRHKDCYLSLRRMGSLGHFWCDLVMFGRGLVYT